MANTIARIKMPHSRVSVETGPANRWTEETLAKAMQEEREKALKVPDGMIGTAAVPIAIVMVILFRVLLAQGARSITGKQLVAELTKAGATKVRQNGSHAIMRYNGRQATVPVHNKDLPRGTLESIRKQLGISK